MNKKTRAHKRIQADMDRKQKKKDEYPIEYVFDLKHFYDCLHSCKKGVNWKTSVKNFLETCLPKIYEDYELLKEGEMPKIYSSRIQIIFERGKLRIITPIHVRDRLNQKVLCEYLLIPLLSLPLIHDNGASLKDKGVDFSRKRMFKHLKSAIREYGTDFYVLKFDFKSYFDSIPHKTCYEILKKYISDERLIHITMEYIKAPNKTQINKIKDKKEKQEMLEKLKNNELCGICLGSQISQIMALIVPNEIDHYIKEKMRHKYYVRYMDDGIILAKDKETLHETLKGIKEIADKLGLSLNDKKTYITKISKGFTFLKIKYYVLENGYVVKKLTREGIVRMRRKLKKFRVLVDEGKMGLDDVYNSMQSWLAHAKGTNSHKTVESMKKLYNELYDGYRISDGGKTSALQTEKWAKYRWDCPNR